MNLILHTVGEDMYIRVWEETNLCFSRIMMGLIIMVTIMGWYEVSSPETRIYEANQLINILEIQNKNPLCNISLFYSFLGSSNFFFFQNKAGIWNYCFNRKVYNVLLYKRAVSATYVSNIIFVKENIFEQRLK